MEPTPQDVQAVSQAMGQPAPAPEPQQQPAPVTPQPAPTQQQPTDPFASFSTPTQQPTEPTQVQTPTPQPTQPVEPSQPTQAVQQQPPQQTPHQPQQPAPQPVQTYEQYIESVLQGVPTAPDMPDPTKIDPNDEQAIGQFFQDLMTTAEKRFEAKFSQQNAIQNSERKLWEDAFGKYPSLREKTNLRNMVHAIRMQEFNQGRAITPTQAAEQLLTEFGIQYQQGVADNQVVTTIQQVQPTGGSSAPVQTSLDTQQVLESVQTGGEDALAKALDAQIKAGNL